MSVAAATLSREVGTMRDVRRHQKKLAKQRRKREERRAELRRRAQEADSEDYEIVTEHTYVSSVDPDLWPGDVSAWPIVRAYVPVRDVWSATGLGMAGIVRQEPDGRHASAFFMLELYDHGLKGAFGKDGESLDEIDLILAEMSEYCPPSEVGPVELAAAFAWGARAFARSHGVDFPKEIEKFFALMPRPEGTPTDWTKKLTGPGGLTPAGLVRLIRDNPQPDDLPEGKELVVLTEATFSITDNERAVAALRGAAPAFAYDGREGEAEVFSWTRKHPGWNPLRLLGGRQLIGSVRVVAGQLVAEAKTLSMTARLIDRLRGLIGEGLRLESCRWTGQDELLRLVDVNSTSGAS